VRVDSGLLYNIYRVGNETITQRRTNDSREHHLFFFSEGEFPLSTSHVELSKLTNENITFYWTICCCRP